MIHIIFRFVLMMFIYLAGEYIL